MRSSHCVLLAGVFAVTVGGPSGARGDGQIGVYGYDTTTPWIENGQDAGQFVTVVVEGLERAVSRLEYSLPLPGFFEFGLASGGHGTGSSFALEFDECTELSGRQVIAEGHGYWIADPPRQDTVVCLGPHEDPSVPATGPMYRSCDGTWHVIDLAENPGWGIEPGCARMWSNVPTQTLSWSMVKSRH